jgi:hypothetical protein
MTCAKSLLFNVTLLVRLGLEPKIARFGGPHGASCGRGLNPRHGPLQSPLRIEIKAGTACELDSTSPWPIKKTNNLSCLEHVFGVRRPLR